MAGIAGGRPRRPSRVPPTAPAGGGRGLKRSTSRLRIIVPISKLARASLVSASRSSRASESLPVAQAFGLLLEPEDDGVGLAEQVADVQRAGWRR